MKYKVIVRPEAEDDVKEAFSWYEDNAAGLGHDFLLQVKAGINFIKRNPASQIFDAQTRKYKGFALYFQKNGSFWLYYAYTTPESLRDMSSVRNKILVENKQRNRVSSLGTIYWQKN